MSFTAIVNTQGNFTAMVNDSSVFNVTANTQGIFNVGIATVGPQGPIGPQGVVSATFPVIYTSETQNISIEPNYFALVSTLDDYLLIADAEITYQTIAGMSAYLTAATAASTYYPLTNPAGYITSSALSGYATESWVLGKNYLISSDLAPYLLTTTAASTYYPLTNPANYITASALSGYATESWVTSQGYALNSSLANYLPLAGGTMTGIAVFSTDGNSDSEVGAWGLGVEKTDDHTQFAEVTYSDIFVSGAGSSTHLLPTGVQFPDATVQTTAWTGSYNPFDQSLNKADSVDFSTVDVLDPTGIDLNKMTVSTQGFTALEFGGIGSPLRMQLNKYGLQLYKSGAGISFPDNTFQSTAATNFDPTGYATESWVTSQGYLTAPYNPFDQDLNKTSTSVWFGNSDGLSFDGIHITPTKTEIGWYGIYNPVFITANINSGNPYIAVFPDYAVYSGEQPMKMSGFGLIFPDGTTQTTAFTGGGDFLPLAGGTMTGNIVFGTAGQYIGKGTFDTSRGGDYGLSLVCSVGYEFNWQAGWLITTEQNSTTPRPLYLDSFAGTSLRAWDSTANTGTEITHTGITFPDTTVQTTAWTGSYNPFDQSLNVNDSVNFNFLGIASGAIQLSSTGIQFPDTTIQTTAASPATPAQVAGFFGASQSGSYATYNPPMTGQYLYYDGTYLNWTSGSGGAYLPLADGGTITATGSGATTVIDGFSIISTFAGYNAQATFSPIQVGTTNTSSGDSIYIYPNGLYLNGSVGINFPDSTVQTTAYTGPQDLSAYLLSSTAASTYFPIPTGNTTQYIAGDGSLITFPTASSADRLETTVYNNSGATIPKHSVVYINGGHGNDPTIALAKADAEPTSRGTFGFTTAAIADQSLGTVLQVGQLTDVNTHPYTEGTLIFLSPTTAGAWTTTQPYSPNHYVALGTITRNHPTLGTIQVRIVNSNELNELSDVQVSSSVAGDLLVNNGSGYWVSQSKNTAGVVNVSSSIVSFVNDGLTNADAPSSTNPFTTEGFVNSAVSAYAASVTPLLPTVDQKAALTAASSPSSSNAIITSSAMTSYVTGYVSSAVPSATTSTEGRVQLATSVEVLTGTNTSKAIVPKDALWQGMSVGFRKTLTSWGSSVSGTGATISNSAEWGRQCQCPNAGNSGYAIAIASGGTQSIISRGQNIAQIDWTKPLLITGSFALAATSDVQNRFRFTIGKPPTGWTVGDLTSRGFGWSFTCGSLLYLDVHDGTTLRQVSTGITIATTAAGSRDFTLYSDGSGNVSLYINDVLVASSANGPTGTGAFYNNGVFCEGQSLTTGTTVNGRCSFGPVSLFFGR